MPGLTNSRGQLRSRPLEIACRATSSSAAPKLAPAILFHIDAVILRSLLDVGEGELAVGVGNALDLVEAGEGVLDMARLGQRLFALPRKVKHAFRQLGPTVNFSVFGARHPSGLCGHRHFLHGWLRVRGCSLNPASLKSALPLGRAGRLQ